jgi:DNA adenine methylase
MGNPNWRKCLLCGNSKDIIKRIPDNSIDFILTDPPYNIGQHSTGNIPLPGRTPMNNDVAEWDHVDFNPEDWAEEFIRILKPTGNLFIFTSYNQLGRWYNCLDHRFDTSNFMIWHKTNPAPKIFKAGFLNSCEMIFTCWNKKHTWNFISQREMHNFMESPICMRPERLSDPKHPAQKPIKILEKMIQIASNENDIIFDPFMGVGSTGIAAMKLNRKFIGIELDKKYFEASVKRVNEELQRVTNNNNKTNADNAKAGLVCEASTLEQQKCISMEQLNLFSTLPDWAEMLQKESKEVKKEKLHKSQEIKLTKMLKPLLKWPGGKEKELKFIIPESPKFNNYYEPFVGGGSVYTAFDANHFYINDKSEELINLYCYIATKNVDFFGWAGAIDQSWKNMLSFSEREIALMDIYFDFRLDKITDQELLTMLRQHLNGERRQFDECLSIQFVWNRDDFFSLLYTTLRRKLLRMKKIEKERVIMPDEDIMDNIETAYMGTLYTYLRSLYNDKHLYVENSPLHTALFLYLRYNSYSGMFRYNDDGDFNVPYGGISYNHKTLEKVLAYYQSEALCRHFENTTMENLDFEEFFHEHQPQEDDFIFLDPPYDSEFSTYAQNDFTQNDQRRLANYLINECHAKWMMVIKATPFILSLYENHGLNIKTFDKTYQVSFMNRNDKDVKHLIIKNYE